MQREALLDRHRGAEARLDAVAGAQVRDLGLDVLGQVLVGEDHIRPHRVAADGRALHAAQDRAERRRFAPGGIRVPRVFVAVVGLIRGLVDAHEARMFRIAAGDGMVFQLAEAARKRHMLGARDVLIAQEQHPMFQQRRADLAQTGRHRAWHRRDSRRPVRRRSRRSIVRLAWLAPQMTKTDEPVVLRDSRSRCACAASSSA